MKKYCTGFHFRGTAALLQQQLNIKSIFLQMQKLGCMLSERSTLFKFSSKYPHKTLQINVRCILVKKASDSFRVAVNRMKHPRECQTEDCANKKCRENGFLLPLYIKRRTRHKVDSDGRECN